MRIPRATYRLQFNRDFTFERAIEILPYLKDLAISDIYASPLFRAGPESTHGYDICCFEEINPDLGGTKDFESFAGHVREMGMGMLVDMVPNHMGGALTNGWWVDVLERGPDSKYAQYFDIDWDPPEPALRDKVLLPLLEDPYARVLENGKLGLVFENGAFKVAYHDRRLPLAPHSIERLKAEAPVKAVLAAYNGQAENPAIFNRLDQLLR